MRDVFAVGKTSTIFFFFFLGGGGGGGVLEIPDMFLGVNGRCRARSYV